jgi:acetyl-CoA carboxylase biotin carboxyl carrier protein
MVKLYPKSKKEGDFMKFEDIKELIELLSEKDIAKVKIKDKDFEITVEKSGKNQAVEVISTAPAQTQPQPQEPTQSAPANQTSTQTPAPATEGTLITSPMVGTFYAAPSPDSPPFVKVGDSVRKGDTLCILEAMKIMNELEAEFDCKILEILVQDGEPVEYDKPLFRVEKL